MFSQEYIQWDKFLLLLKAMFAVVVWGASFIATKVALKDVDSITVVLVTIRNWSVDSWYNGCQT